MRPNTLGWPAAAAAVASLILPAFAADVADAAALSTDSPLAEDAPAPGVAQDVLHVQRGDGQQKPLGGSESNSDKTTGWQKKKKNIVVILTDDQDLTMDSLSYMPFVKRHLSDQGVNFKNHFTSTSICCPARVSLWTGKLPHNTNVTDVSPPYGGYPKFVAQGLNENYLPVWLQEAGYSTYYVGKLFNAHTIRNYNAPYVAGWTGSDFLLDPGTYSFLNPIFQRNQDPPVHHKDEHTAPLTEKKALGFLDEALEARRNEKEGEEKPFFLAVAPIAPHSNIDAKNRGEKLLMTEPIPLPKHEKLFDGVQVPRTENFNPDKPSSVSWIAKLAQFNQSSIAYLDHFYRQRLRALQSVDELVDSIVGKLERAGVLDDTYLIYSSDNGYHIGQHRLPPGKMCAFEEDIRVPLLVRGPGIKLGHEETGVTAHVDLAPTILELAGAKLRPDFDGRPIPLDRAELVDSDPSDSAYFESITKARGRRQEHASIEFWGSAISEGEGGGFDGQGQIVIRNNTYKALRVKGAEYDLLYSVWCNNEHELYDLTNDPGQLNNLYPGTGTPDDLLGQALNSRHALDGNKIARVISRLDALMMVLKSCKGDSCRDPWSVLHPTAETTDEPEVRTLTDALHSRFDAFYEGQDRVAYNRCEMGYIIASEGPQDVAQYKRQSGDEDQLHSVWPHWT